MEIALSFVGVFVGAFLAIGLENWRERRVIRRWVREHLEHLMGFIGLERPGADEVQSTFQAIDRALDSWATTTEPLDEGTWELLNYTVTANPIDFTHLLRSEAVAVLPRSLSNAIADVEYWSGMLGMTSSRLREAFDAYVLPLWFERRVPLTEADRRRLRFYQEELRDLLEKEMHATEAIDRMVEEYRAFAGGRSVTKGTAPRE
ncbi:hypothetical protein [Flindersiella endophytica]